MCVSVYVVLAITFERIVLDLDSWQGGLTSAYLGQICRRSSWSQKEHNYSFFRELNVGSYSPLT